MTEHGGLSDVEARRWERLQELFEAALDWPADARIARLEREVRDPDLRAQVAALLGGHEVEGPLDELAAALAPTPATSESDGAARPPDGVRSGGSPRDGSPRPPERVGPYDILEVLGHGGTASVYLARRTAEAGAPSVALKVVRPDADSERVRRRFLAERQILARIRHRGISRLLDDGLTEAGAPFLVTEYVEGPPITEFCDGRRLGIEERLELVLQVCDAVAYAHAHGVVHRDLKPANILVDGTGGVRLLDFGIAKILQRDAFPGAGRPTTTGIHLMTPKFASPEQLLDRPVAEPSDLYQLGLLLYLLLSGRLPPIGSRIRLGMPGGRDQPPVPCPSDVVRDDPGVTGHGRSTSSASSARAIADARGETVDGLVSRLRGRLDALVMRAIHEDAEVRYSSADALAADVRRYLSEPTDGSRGPLRWLRSLLGT